MISYEVFFDERARSAVRAGGQVLVVPTNTASYRSTQVPTQELAAARLRAWETGRWLLQVTPTGYTAIVGPTGKVVQRTTLDEQRVIEGTVPRETGHTVYVTLGDTPIALLALLVTAELGIRPPGPPGTPPRPVEPPVVTSAPEHPGVGVLFVCTGNMCRSPMAEAFLRAELATRGVPVAVASAGFVTEGAAPPPEVVRVMGAAGIDVSAHRSRRIGAELVERRRCGGHHDPAAPGRAHHRVPRRLQPELHLRRMLHRGERIGPRRSGEPLEQWAGRIHGGRARSSGLELGPGGDVDDPMGGPLRDYERARRTLAGMAARLAVLLDPTGPDRTRPDPTAPTAPPPPPPPPSRPPIDPTDPVTRPTRPTPPARPPRTAGCEEAWPSLTRLLPRVTVSCSWPETPPCGSRCWSTAGTRTRAARASTPGTCRASSSTSATRSRCSPASRGPCSMKASATCRFRAWTCTASPTRSGSRDRREFHSRIDLAEFGLMCTAGFPEPLTFSWRVRRELAKRAGQFDVVHDNQTFGRGLLGVMADGWPLARAPATTRSPSTGPSTSSTPTTLRRKVTLRRWYGFLRHAEAGGPAGAADPDRVHVVEARHRPAVRHPPRTARRRAHRRRPHPLPPSARGRPGPRAHHDDRERRRAVQGPAPAGGGAWPSFAPNAPTPTWWSSAGSAPTAPSPRPSTGSGCAGRSRSSPGSATTAWSSCTPRRPWRSCRRCTRGSPCRRWRRWRARCRSWRRPAGPSPRWSAKTG